MKNHCKKIENYAMFYEWFLEKAMSEIVCIDTRRISECCVCELPLCNVCVGCDWVLSGFNEKRVVIVFFFISQEWLLYMHSIIVIFMSFYKCMSIVIVREEMTLKIGGEKWMLNYW